MGEGRAGGCAASPTLRAVASSGLVQMVRTLSFCSYPRANRKLGSLAGPTPVCYQ
jgi:hypothetical protein